MLTNIGTSLQNTVSAEYIKLWVRQKLWVRLEFQSSPCYTIPRCKAHYTQAVTGSLLCTLRRKPRSIGLAADSRR